MKKLGEVSQDKFGSGLGLNTKGENQDWSGLVGKMSLNMRKLVCQFYGVFRELQLAAQQEDFGPNSVILASAAYRNVIETTCKDMLVDESSEELELLYDCGAIWYLCEICLLNNEGSVSLKLIDWLNSIIKNDYDINANTFMDTNQYPEPEKSQEYWEILYRYALANDMDQVSNLICLDSQYRQWAQGSDPHEDLESELHKLYNAIEQILTYYPLNDEGSFRMDSFRTWQNAIQEHILTNKHLDDKLRVVFEILVGDKEIIREYSKNWKEFLCAHIGYCEPQCTIIDLESLFKKLLRYFPECQDDGLFNLYLNITQKNISKVVVKVGEIGSWWMVSHLVDLFYHADIVQDHLGIEQKREDFFSKYSQALSNQNLINLIPAYLCYCCPKTGKDLLRKILEKTPIRSEKQAVLFLGYCTVYELGVDFTKILKTILANQMHQNKQYCSALRWYTDAGEIKSATEVTTLLLNDVVKRFRLCDAALLRLIVNDIQSKEKIQLDEKFKGKINDVTGDSLEQNLQFLVVFHRIVAAFQLDRFDIVQEGLILLFQGIAPKRFWLSFLLDIQVIIEEQKFVFGVAELTVFMRALEQLSFSIHTEFLGEPTTFPTTQQILKNVLIQNYAKSLMRNTNIGVGASMTGII